jgi:hypothetical protein
MRAHWWSWWLRRMVLPLPRFPLRYFRPYKKGTRSFEPRDSRIRLPRRPVSYHWLN